MKREWTFAVLALSLATGCDAVVGLEAPADGELDGGAFQDAGENEGGEQPTPGPDAGAIVDTGPPNAAPFASWPLPDGVVVDALAFGYSNTLYILQTDETAGSGIALYFASLASAPTPRWSGGADGLSLAGLCTVAPSSVYFGDSSGTTNEIRVFDAAADQQQALTTPGVVVDIAGAMPGARLGPLIGLACDAQGLFWTQTVDGTTALLRHDLGSDPLAVTVVFSARTGDSLNQVAVDASTIYTVGTDGTVYSIPRDATDADRAVPSPIATSALPTTPLVASGGGVYYLQGSVFTQMGDLYYASPAGDADASTYARGYQLQTFAFAGSTLLMGSGANFEYATPTSCGPQTVVGTPGSSPVAFVAGAAGWGAWANAVNVGLSQVQQN
jgi:hypothetical protein